MASVGSACAAGGGAAPALDRTSGALDPQRNASRNIRTIPGCVEACLSYFDAHSASWKDGQLPRVGGCEALTALLSAFGIPRSKVVTQWRAFRQKRDLEAAGGASLHVRASEEDVRRAFLHALGETESERLDVAREVLRAVPRHGAGGCNGMRDMSRDATAIAFVLAHLEALAAHAAAVTPKSLARVGTAARALAKRRDALAAERRAAFCSAFARRDGDLGTRAVFFFAVLELCTYERWEESLVPPEAVHPPQEGPCGADDPVLYFVSGWLLRCLRRDKKGMPALLRTMAEDFVDANRVQLQDARRARLPTKTVEDRNRGGLIFASPRFFVLVQHFERYARVALCARAFQLYLSETVTRARDTMASDAHGRELFHACCPAWGAASQRVGDFEERAYSVLVAKFFRMRGREFVRRANAGVKRAKEHVAIRQNLAAISSASSARAAASTARPQAAPEMLSGAEEDEPDLCGAADVQNLDGDSAELLALVDEAETALQTEALGEADSELPGAGIGGDGEMELQCGS